MSIPTVGLPISHGTFFSLPTVCVTCVWAGVDSLWEQKKLEARKILENAAESHTSGARFVGTLLPYRTFWFYDSLE